MGASGCPGNDAQRRCFGRKPTIDGCRYPRGQERRQDEGFPDAVGAAALGDQYVWASPDHERPTGSAVCPGADGVVRFGPSPRLESGELRVRVRALNVNDGAVAMRLNSELETCEQGDVEETRVLGDVFLVGSDE